MYCIAQGYFLLVNTLSRLMLINEPYCKVLPLKFMQACFIHKCGKCQKTKTPWHMSKKKNPKIFYGVFAKKHFFSFSLCICNNTAKCTL